jgi:hypothetical protein
MKILHLKILDKVVIVVLLLASILPAGIVMLGNKSKPSDTIVIKVDSKIVKTVPLTNNSGSKTYDFKFNNNIGYIEVNNGKVRMLEMDKSICPNAICSDTGWISKPYQTIVCLPNHITLTLEGSKKDDIDVQSF